MYISLLHPLIKPLLVCSQNEIDDMIRKLANVLLTRTLSGCLSELIKRPQLSLLQVGPISRRLGGFCFPVVDSYMIVQSSAAYCIKSAADA